MSLKCCNKYCQILETIPLRGSEGVANKVLTVGRCRNPKCGCLKAQIIYFDCIKGQFVYENIRSKDVIEVVQKYKNEPYLTDIPKSLKFGSRANMSWKFQKNGSIFDFNNTFIDKLKSELIIIQ